MDDRDYDVVIAKVPKVNESGRDVSNDEFGPGGKRDEEGRISALAYDFQPLEEDDEDDDSLEEVTSEAMTECEAELNEVRGSNDELVFLLVKVLGATVVLGGTYLIGRYHDEINIAAHKAGRWIKSKVFKQQLSEEKVFFDDLKLLNKSKERIEKIDYEINTSFKKSWKFYDKTINDGVKKLSKLIDNYNSSGSIYSLQLLLNYIFTLKICLNDFENAAEGQPVTCIQNWKSTIVQLNMVSFLIDVKNIINNDSDVRNELIVNFGENKDIDEDKLVEAVKLFLVGDEAA